MRSDKDSYNIFIQALQFFNLKIAYTLFEMLKLTPE
jgi:hypothetical protein